MSSDESHEGHDRPYSNDKTGSGRERSGAPKAVAGLGGTDAERASRTESLAGTSSTESREYDGNYEADAASVYPQTYYARPQTLGLGYTAQPGSNMGSPDLAASTRSLWAQDLDYREIHGRRYCREYYMPNDEIEQLRLALMHQVFLHVLDGELTIVPLDEPERILDVGCGTGDWAMRMAELYPECEIVGTDISAIAETSGVPMNVFFEIEDAEDWDRPADHYDFIHLRMMDGSFRDWLEMYSSIWYSLRPSGWIQVTDFDSTECFARFMELFSKDSSIHDLFRDSHAAAEKSGRPRGTAHLDPDLLIKAGFGEVRAVEHIIPITIAERSAGKIWLIACLDAFEAAFLRPLTEHMGWDPDECKAACESAAREMAEIAKDPERNKGLYIRMRTVTGLKPVGDFDYDMTSGDQTPIGNVPGRSRRQSPTSDTTQDADEAGSAPSSTQ